MCNYFKYAERIVARSTAAVAQRVITVALAQLVTNWNHRIASPAK